MVTTKDMSMNRRLLVLSLGTFAIGTDAYVIAGILPRVAGSFSVTVAAAGQLVTAYALVYGLLTPVMAASTAHWPRRRVLLLGLTVFIAGNVLTATSASFALVLASRAVAGLGAALFTPAASATAAALVPLERRGRALAVVLAGLSGATALGAPLGTLVGSLGDWRLTLWFVAGVATLTVLGVLALLPHVAGSPGLALRDRLAPLGDGRVAAALATIAAAMLGVFLVYTYVSVVFDRATGGRGALVAALIASWGLAATVGSLRAGSLTDRFGNRRVMDGALAILVLDFVLMPWSSATLPGAIIALAVWGLCGWGFVVAQQHRLVGMAPALAPILLALNASAIYLAVSVSGAAGALAIRAIDAHRVPLLSAVLILAALGLAELTHRRIVRHATASTPTRESMPVSAT
jgi:MFS transporter, DHA1 family, inner membrane transport protein